MMELQWGDDGRSPAGGLRPTSSHFSDSNKYDETDRSPCRHAFLANNSSSFTLSTADDASRDDASAAPSQVSGTFSCAVTDEASVGDISSARGDSSYRERITGIGNSSIEPEKPMQTQRTYLKQPFAKVDAKENLQPSLLQRPKKQVSFSRPRHVKMTRLQQPIASPRCPDADATPASPSSPCFLFAAHRRRSPPPPVRSMSPFPDEEESCSSTAPSPNRLSRSPPLLTNSTLLLPMEARKSQDLLAVPLRPTSVAPVMSSTSMGGAEGEGEAPISPTPSISPSPKMRAVRRQNTCPTRRPKDFPPDFAIQPKIEEFEKRVDPIALDEKTLKQFDVANRPVRRLHRSQTVPVTDPDDWWGVQSAPSEGSDGDVVCEYFAIGTPSGGRSRASSVCSLGSIYSRSSRGSSRSSRSMRSARSAISSSSLYNCSSNGSNASLYSSDGSLYD